MLILSVVTACGVLLVLLALLVFVVICRLRPKWARSEPQLLTFSQSACGPESCGPSGFLRGIVNQGFATDFTQFDNCSAADGPPIDGRPVSRDGEFFRDDSDTESTHALEILEYEQLQYEEKQGGLAPKKCTSTQAKRFQVQTVPELHAQPATIPPTIHSEHGVAEYVNPLYRMETSKQFLNFPLESITEDDIEHMVSSETSSEDIHHCLAFQNPSQSCDGVSTTFYDVDHKSLRPAPGVDMSDTVSGTQSCPNTPLMSARAGRLQSAEGGACYGWSSNLKPLWTSDVHVTQDDVDDDRSFRGSDCVNVHGARGRATNNMYGSWSGHLDDTWEARTSF